MGGTRIYLIRHAEAEGNIYRRAHGHYNGQITIKGHRQIKLLRQRFRKEQIDAVYSSDLTRAVTTAMALAEPRELEILTMPGLREVDMGSWEDVTWGDIEYNYPEMSDCFSNDPANWQIEGGEPYEDVGNRMYNCLLEIAQRHEGRTVAVFSHGFAIRTLLARLRAVASNEIEQVPHCDNTAVSFITFDGTGFTVEYAGDNAHLKGGNSTLEKQSWWKADEEKGPENLRYFSLGDVASESLLRAFKAKAGDRALVDTQYAAYLGAEPVGILGLDTLREANRKIGWISYIHVVPQHRKHSFGTQMIGLAVSDFRKLRREKLRIELPSGSSGINFMGKCGFSVLVTTETTCLMEIDIRNW